jgi:hypothetical protein
MRPSTRPTGWDGWDEPTRAAHRLSLEREDLTLALEEVTADRDWWRRTCWACLLLALVASGGWAWTVIR